MKSRQPTIHPRRRIQQLSLACITRHIDVNWLQEFKDFSHSEISAMLQIVRNKPFVYSTSPKGLSAERILRVVKRSGDEPSPLHEVVIRKMEES